MRNNGIYILAIGLLIWWFPEKANNFIGFLCVIIGILTVLFPDKAREYIDKIKNMFKS